MKLKFLFTYYFFFCMSNLIEAQFYYDSNKVEYSTNRTLQKVMEKQAHAYYNHIGINISWAYDYIEDDSLFQTIPTKDLKYLFLHPDPYIRA